MASRNRDEFAPKTKLQIAKRAGWLCSDPSCRRYTIGSNSDGNGEVDLGVAAHICAAAPGGPRYEVEQTPEQRRSPDNGIWLCRLHGTAVDAKDSAFTVERLHEWKAQAQKDSWQRVLYNDLPPGPAIRVPTHHELSQRIRAAAAADLDVFRRSAYWPPTAIALTLEVEGQVAPVGPSALATALTTLDDLILVAPPGMGKTTTLFQIAEAVLANDSASPIVVPLGDWSTEGAALVDSILKRPAFREISEADLRAVAAAPGVVLLLDGWNELDTAARRRLATQIRRLQDELPELSLLISTRKQVLDVPIDGARINLQPLSDSQQREVASALRGVAGLRMVEQASRTSGVRDLVTIPLYLTALLDLPDDLPFPTTKEEVLRRFVAVHEEDRRHVEVLAEVTHRLHPRFLEELAATATRAANTTLAEAVARVSVSATDDALVREGQITVKPQPEVVLEALVNHHVLVRVGNPPGYSFQHQQFLEWYASHVVERLMLSSIGEATSRAALKADVLNVPVWEEAILFACERLARGSQMQQDACGSAILAAFEVDPLLAAEMICRSTDVVWGRIGATLHRLIQRWHTVGAVDRALRFMLCSGRPEFLDQVWPLIAHRSDQVNLSALRACRRFRPSILGRDAARRVAALAPEVRKNVLHEVAFNSGIDGLELVTAIAKDDPDPDVKAAVIEALAFRRADRHVADLLRGADDETFDTVVRKELVDESPDEQVMDGIAAARERRRKKGVSAYDRLRTIVRAQGNEDLSGELAAIVAEMEIPAEPHGVVHLLHAARNRYSQAICDGLLSRVRVGRNLWYGADDFLASADLSLEDDGLLQIALSASRHERGRAEAAASVLGPVAVGRLIDAAFEVKQRVRDAGGTYDQAAGDRYNDLLDRIQHTTGSSLISAVRARSAQAGNLETAALADLIARHPNGDTDRVRPYGAATLATIATLAEDWGNRMLASGDATRSQLAAIALLVCRAPSVGLLGLLQRLLDDNLRRYRAFREEAQATGWQNGRTTNEARTPHTHEYQRAFQSIPAPETAVLMREYLHDEHFGQQAAIVLAAQWMAANEPIESVRGGVDFSRVEERRAARASNPTATSAEAEAIFGALEPLIADRATEEQKRHAVGLGIIAACLPHGQRDATIRKIIALAPHRSRAALFRNLILSGECVDIDLIKCGLSDLLEEAKSKSWLLTEGTEKREWLSLVPFTSDPTQALAIVRGLPDSPHGMTEMEAMIAGFGMVGSDEAENALFELAEADPKLYANHAWQAAALRRGSLSTARRLVNLAANGVFEGERRHSGHMARQLGGLMGDFPELRPHVYRLLSAGATTVGLQLLAQAVAESPDADGLLLLVKIESEQKLSIISWRTIETVVTEHVPAENWKGAYNVVPVPVGELRRQLLAMTTDGGPTDAAAACLNHIDEIRDEYGTPDSEPRHPDLASGKPWPIIVET